MGNLLLCFSCNNRVTPKIDGSCPTCQRPTRPAANAPPANANALASMPNPAMASAAANDGATFTPYKPLPPSIFERPGFGSVIVGGLMCGLGVAITAISYSAAASNPNGGHYVVTWGLVVFGGIRLVKGLAMLFA